MLATTASVAQRMHAGVVRYRDGDEEDAISLDDYAAVDAELLSDFPDDSPPLQQAAAPAPVEDGGDNWDGPPRDPEPRRG